MIDQIVLDPASEAVVRQEALPQEAPRCAWAPAEEPRVVHALPGRLRVHLPRWTGDGAATIELKLTQAPGVTRVRANPATGNVLICFDPAAADERTLLGLLRLLLMVGAAAPTDGAQAPSVVPRAATSPARTCLAARTARTSHRRPNRPKAELLLKGVGIVAGLALAETPLAPALVAMELMQLIVRYRAQTPAA